MNEYLSQMTDKFRLWTVRFAPPCEQVALWWTLFSLSGYRAQSFGVSNSVLELSAGLNRKKLRRAREALVSAGWLSYTPGKGRRGPSYMVLEGPYGTTQTALQNGMSNLEGPYETTQTALQNGMSNLEGPYGTTQTALQNETRVSPSKLKDLKEDHDHHHDQFDGDSGLSDENELRERVRFCYRDLYQAEPTEAQLRVCTNAMTVHGAEWQLVHWSLYQASLRDKPSHYGLTVLRDMLSHGIKTRDEAEMMIDSRRSKAAATRDSARTSNNQRDERYSAFYDLYPDA